MPVSVQLDHVGDVDVIKEGVAAGADAVLVDGSALDYDENIALVRCARQSIRSPEVVFEAEIGALAGDEDRAFSVSAVGLTDPYRVDDFVTRDVGLSYSLLPLETCTGDTRVYPSFAGISCGILRLGPTFRWCCTELLDCLQTIWQRRRQCGLARSTSTRNCAPGCFPRFKVRYPSSAATARTYWGCWAYGKQQCGYSLRRALRLFLANR